jgi:hypothetical protein
MKATALIIPLLPLTLLSGVRALPQGQFQPGFIDEAIRFTLPGLVTCDETLLSTITALQSFTNTDPIPADGQQHFIDVAIPAFTFGMSRINPRCTVSLVNTRDDRLVETFFPGGFDQRCQVSVIDDRPALIDGFFVRCI